MPDSQSGSSGGGEGQTNFCDIEMQVLSRWTYNLALNIVPENVQCILMRLDRGGKRYRIITGLPSDNRRHGIGEVGHLYEPVPKTALLEAVQTNEVAVIQQAGTDPRVDYMERHVFDKGIEAIAIVPIRYEEAVRWLIVIDRVPPSRPGFSDQELVYLKSRKHWIESQELPFVQLGAKADYGLTTLRGILDNYGHEIRSRIMPIGGYAQLIKKNLGPENVRIARFVEHIIKESRRCENELVAFTKLIVHLYSPEEAKEPIPVGALRDYFRDIPNKHYHDDGQAFQGITVMSYKNPVDAVFSELARYIATTGRELDETRITIAQDDYTVTLVIKNPVFQDYKKDMDIRLSLFEHIIRKADASIVYGRGECRISFHRD